MSHGKYPETPHADAGAVEVGRQLAVPHILSLGQQPPFTDCGHDRKSDGHTVESLF